MDNELVLVEEEEMLSGLLLLTGNNMGAAHSLLDKTIKETTKAVKAAIKQSKTVSLDETLKETAKQNTLKKLGQNIEHELKLGKNRAYRKLNKNMRNSTQHPAKLDNTVAHHLVALTDPRVQEAFQILIAFNIDVNDEVNGVYLPQNKNCVPHSSMPKAVAHSQIHTTHYHVNVRNVLLNISNVPGATRGDMIKALRRIAQRLQAGIFPIHKKV